MTELREFKAEIFKALAHPARIQIIDALRDGEHSVNELCEILDTQSSNVSQQLSILRSRNLVNTRKDGNTVFYSVRDKVIFKLLDSCRKVFENYISSLSVHIENGRNALMSLLVVLFKSSEPLWEWFELVPLEVCA